MNISIMPLYFCDRKCEFCYLGNVKDKTIMDLSKLKSTLDSIPNIQHIDIYGGELGLLEESYFMQLLHLCKEYSNSISCMTNYSTHNVINWVYKFNKFTNNEVSVGVSANKERGKQLNLSNLKGLSNVCLVQVVTKSLIDNPKKAFKFIQKLGIDVQFLQYYPSLNARINYSISNRDYENFMISFLNLYLESNSDFKVYNIDHLIDVSHKVYNPLLKAHLFINPSCKLGITKYDSKGLEYFHFVDTYEEFNKLSENIPSQCILCKCYGSCGAEHLKPFTDTCPGHLQLQNWWDNYGSKLWIRRKNKKNG